MHLPRYFELARGRVAAGSTPGGDNLMAKEKNWVWFSRLATGGLCGIFAISHWHFLTRNPTQWGVLLIPTQAGKGNICDSNLYTLLITSDQHMELSSVKSTLPSEMYLSACIPASGSSTSPEKTAIPLMCTLHKLPPSLEGSVCRLCCRGTFCPHLKL